MDPAGASSASLLDESMELKPYKTTKDKNILALQETLFATILECDALEQAFSKSMVEPSDYTIKCKRLIDLANIQLEALVGQGVLPSKGLEHVKAWMAAWQLTPSYATTRLFVEKVPIQMDTDPNSRREVELVVAISQGLSSVEAHATLLVEQSECTAANMDNRLSALTGLLASYTRLPPDWPSSLALRKWDQRFRAMGPNDGLSAQEGAELLYALSTARADFVNVTRGGR
jgi:hypothetical protein